MTLAFKDTPMSKKEAIEKAVAHRLADEFAQGQWWENGKGCSLGCMFHDLTDDNWFETASSQTGIPLEIVHLQERIFEGLPVEKAKHWTERFYRAVPEGVDLSSVTPKFLLWLLIDETCGVIRFTKEKSEQRRAVLAIADMLRRKIDGDNPEPGEWTAARAAADAAARADAEETAACTPEWSATRAAWDAAWSEDSATRGTWAATRAAAGAVERAAEAAAAVNATAWTAAEAAAEAAEATWPAAWDAAMEAMADKLVELLDLQHAIYQVEGLHANGSEIVRKEQD